MTLSDFILSANEIFQPVFLSSRCALVRSDDRNAIILFSTNAGLLFANSVKASGEAASIFFRKPILAYSPWASLLIVWISPQKVFLSNSSSLGRAKTKELNDKEELENLADIIKQAMFQDYKVAFSEEGDTHKEESKSTLTAGWYYIWNLSYFSFRQLEIMIVRVVCHKEQT